MFLLGQCKNYSQVQTEFDTLDCQIRQDSIVKLYRINNRPDNTIYYVLDVKLIVNWQAVGSIERFMCMAWARIELC